MKKRFRFGIVLIPIVLIAFSGCGGGGGNNGTVPTSNPTQPPAGNGVTDDTITSSNGYVLVNDGGQNYIVQNNVSTGITQTITYSGNNFKVTAFNGESPTNAAPGSFPSVFIGKCRTNETPSVGLPKQNSSCSTIPVSWSWSATSVSGTYNALFELWFSTNSSGDSGEPSGGKLIVWLTSPSGPQPTGSMIGTVPISSGTYNVYYGTLNGTPCVTYVTKSTVSDTIDLNLFIEDAISRGYISNSHYLTTIFAGFQIWKGGVGLESKSLSIHVN
jgi:hypothetical protein